MKITSPAFANFGTIPQNHTGFGEDISPEFRIDGAPDGTVSFAVLLDDLDVPFCRRFNHWILWNLPKTDVIPEGLPAGAAIWEPVSACQGIAWGKHRYRGPKPPFFIRNTHRYVFTVYALDCMLDIPTESDKTRFFNAMDGHVLAKTEIVGKYGRA